MTVIRITRHPHGLPPERRVHDDPQESISAADCPLVREAPVSQTTSMAARWPNHLACILAFFLLLGGTFAHALEPPRSVTDSDPTYSLALSLGKAAISVNRIAPQAAAQANKTPGPPPIAQLPFDGVFAAIAVEQGCHGPVRARAPPLHRPLAYHPPSQAPPLT